GSESIASNIVSATNGVNIAATAGTLTILWDASAGAEAYNVYKATPVLASGQVPPVGASFGYAGTAFGTQFVDSNIVADMTQVPPLHKDPFARGQIVLAQPLTSGTLYTRI